MRNPLAGLSRRRDMEARADANLIDSSSELFRLFVTQYTSHAGVSVTSDTAIASVAVLACLLVRAESLMLCPLNIIRREGDRKIRDREHPAARLLSDEPNPFLSAEEFWRWKQITEDLYGNAYARVEWRRGRPVAIWPLLGGSPQIVYGNGRMVYRYQGDETIGTLGEQMTPAGDYPASEILHFKGSLLKNPYEGKSLVRVTAENIGLGLATEEFFARFLGGGTHFPRYLETDEVLKQADLDALKLQLKDGSGLLGAGQLRIFDRGLKVKQSDMSLKDADLTGQQRWILEQTCRTWRVPLPIVQDLTHGTYTNSEQADLWLGKHTIRPICANTQSVVRRRLFLPSERSRYISRFDVEGLMRGDFKTRAASYSVLINCGMLSPNEGRGFEDWDGYEGGEQYRLPVNTESASGGDEPGWQPAEKRDGDEATKALAPVMADAVARIRKRAAQDRERGRDVAATLEFARRVVAPIEESLRALGADFDGETIIAATLEDGR